MASIKDYDNTLSQYDDQIYAAARQHNIPPAVYRSIIAAESSGNTNAQSGAGAVGLPQMTQIAVDDVNQRYNKNYTLEDMKDPGKSLEAGALHFKTMLKTFDGDTSLAVAGYNMGPGALNKLLKSAGPDSSAEDIIKRLPQETQGYIKKVSGFSGDQGGNVSGRLAKNLVQANNTSGGLLNNAVNRGKDFENKWAERRYDGSQPEINEKYNLPSLNVGDSWPTGGNIIPNMDDGAVDAGLEDIKYDPVKINQNIQENPPEGYDQSGKNFQDMDFQQTGLINSAINANSPINTAPPIRGEDYEGPGVGSEFLNQIPVQTSDWASSTYGTPATNVSSFNPQADPTAFDLPWVNKQDPPEIPSGAENQLIPESEVINEFGRAGGANQERSLLSDATSMIPEDVKNFGSALYSGADNLLGDIGRSYGKYVDNKNEMARQSAHQERYGNLGANQPGSMNYQEPAADPKNQRFNPETGEQIIQADPNNQQFNPFIKRATPTQEALYQQFNPETGQPQGQVDPNSPQFDPATGLKLGPDGKPIPQDETPIGNALLNAAGQGALDIGKNVTGYNLGKTYSDFFSTPSHEFWDSPLAAIGNFGKNVAYNLPVAGPSIRKWGDTAKKAYNWADLQYNKGNWGGGR